MPVRLTWEETNLNEDGHRIYRSTSPMDPESLPTALATLGANVTQYDDATAADSTTYYYRVSAYIGSIEQVSDEVEITTEEFDPSTLFGSGTYEGFWFDPSDLSTMYQDSGATTPVTTDGDPVGYIADKSGNGNHAIQTTAGQRPIYHTDGTFHWLEFDRTQNQKLELTQTISGSQDRTVCFGLEQASFGGSGSNRSFLSLQNSASTSSGGDWSPSMESDDFWIRVDGNWHWDYTGGAEPVVPCVVFIRWGTSYGTNLSDTECRIDGIDLSSAGGADRTVNTDNDGTSAIGFSARQSSNYYDGKMYQMFAIRNLLSDVERGLLEEFVAAKAEGVSLGA